jgi:hypothetical protein
MTIVEFLNARLDEDQAEALATTPVPVPGRWKAARDKHAPDDAPLFLVQGEDEYEPGSENYSGNSPVIAYSAEWQPGAEADLRHIARHDPARVLREVVVKRRVLERHGTEVCMCIKEYGGDLVQAWYDDEPCPELRDLAAPYDGHPDFHPAWAIDVG